MTIHKFQHAVPMGTSVGICENLGDEKSYKEICSFFHRNQNLFCSNDFQNVVKYTFNFLNWHQKSLARKQQGKTLIAH